jgi:xanthine dehydrogenase accessory factor
MESADRQVLDTAIAWLAAGHQAALATVAQTWGSSPRPPGSWAVVRDDGAVAGSVSGGCIEEDLVRRVRADLLARPTPEVLTYGATPEEAARFGLPCGGTVRLVLEPNPDLADLRTLRQRVADGRVTARSVEVASGRVTLQDAARSDAMAWDGLRLTTIHGPQLRLLIIGAVQVSHYLATMAQALGYEVTVCDPREEYHGTWRLAGIHLSTEMPDDAVTALKPDTGTAIVALTHDPKLDDLALLEALRSPAFYVGALGSQRNNAKRRERLEQHLGMTAAELAPLRGPVGLPIGSRTPPEIAVSILAEMIAAKYGVDRQRGRGD